MKTGLYFGSFNPIHNGHLAIAQYMVQVTGLEEVWFVVSPLNPLKRKEFLIEEKDRIELVRLAIAENSSLNLCDIETRLPQPSYTINTLRQLRIDYPERQFVLIMGTDNLKSLHLWKDYLEIIHDYEIFVYPRPGYEQYPNYPVHLVDAPTMNISATNIRRAIKNGKVPEHFLPAKVIEYIQAHHLYQKNRTTPGSSSMS